ncbi:PTS sugar transporter subunit IIA [Companilactobacillus bobalius]|uniref:Protein-N(Pi)-phosphohistidine--sugar phosphotransferase n=1 Tax=Companilactobacillus bobalius TaxID=2801451 RepID=A0A202FAP3_9LACO|nr:PTS sugar transporter subunit IIA [Companilactobacillus bobalius]OVE97535.1 Protein-N(pi)-phosphohistidine--sugar phosphotransferase [Companilactobacillus bobalius]GEO57854.1 PTS sugar transporter subunit IIA [Companilactobacillus paralimentarius]
MKVDIDLDKALFLPHMTADDSTDVIEQLSSQLYESGYVKKDYINAIKKREMEYPTGLPSKSPAVAIPHADFNLVNKTTVAVGTLETPVEFHDMEDIKKTIPVQIVIMLAIGEPHGQVEMLQRIVGIIQDEKLRNDILNANTSEELLNLIEPSLLGILN